MLPIISSSALAGGTDSLFLEPAVQRVPAKAKLEVGDAVSISGTFYVLRSRDQQIKRLKHLLAQVILPSLNFEGAHLADVLEFIRVKADDILSQNEAQLHPVFSSQLPGYESYKRITVKRKNVNVLDAIESMAAENGWTVTYLPNGVLIGKDE